MNVTLKDFPPELHSKLKSLAESSGRSLNRQIVHLLEAATTPRRVDDTELMHRIRANRTRMQGTVDREFMERAISEGRK